MVDILALSLSHGLLLLAAWRLLRRPELDVEMRDVPSPAVDASRPAAHREARGVMRMRTKAQPAREMRVRRADGSVDSQTDGQPGGGGDA
ncbi:hypothetical protein GR702_02045 [Novosphingobium sp. FGD1]|uniref:Uncharacterized protein n=1 Tax=Novosphingobium silvae TaxID=2692619 RepID=A0A7X4GE13_9SPHN|nr:hypothetical protein [Novosphingobium silvae]MYL96556.1 hypothetical protein [Novosphingobium silvae]